MYYAFIKNQFKDARLRHKGFTLWFTGMSGAGKSTIAGLIETGGPRRPRTFLTWDQIRNEFFLSLKYS
jgi:adenylylsulfate kinase-like enzyme